MKTMIKVEELEGYLPSKKYICKCGGQVAWFDTVTLTGYCSNCYVLGRDVWDKTRKATVSARVEL